MESRNIKHILDRFIVAKVSLILGEQSLQPSFYILRHCWSFETLLSGDVHLNVGCRKRYAHQDRYRRR